MSLARCHSTPSARDGRIMNTASSCDPQTLNLMARQGQWLRTKGLVKEGQPTIALYRKWIAVERLRALDVARVTIAP